MDTIVIYFSKSGRTRDVAEDIAEMIGADTFEIVTEKQYPKSYLKTVAEGRRELSNQSRLDLVTEQIDLSGYSRVLIGYPVWFGTCPMAVISFLEKNDLAGKDIYPFCTSATSGASKSTEDIQRCVLNANVHKGLRIRKMYSDDVVNWLQSE